jgi:hypothetical protein
MTAINFPNSPTLNQSFTVGTVTYTWNGESWLSSAAASPLAIYTQAGSAYTAQITDARSVILFTNSASSTFTIPPESSVAWGYPTTITVIQQGSGQVTITGGTGVTVNKNSFFNLKTAGPWSTVQLIRIAQDVWVAMGCLELA